MKIILKNIKLLLISTLFGILSIFSYSAIALSTDWVVNDKSKVRLISTKTKSDNSDVVILGLEYQLDPGWKTYWKSPGGGGFPQKIDWNNSVNIENIKIDWPRPKEFEILGLTSIGYEERVIFPLSVKLKNKNILTKFNLKINYLVCKDICIPGNADLYFELLPGEAQYTEFFYEIEKVKSSIPFQDINLSPINNLSTKAVKNSNKVNITISVESDKSFLNPNIYIHTPFGLPFVQPLNNYSLNLKKIDTTFTYNSDQFSKNNFPIEILIMDKNHNFSYIKNISLDQKTSNFNFNNSLFYILIISLFGGFILNLMPCVFPVLSIKLLSVLNNQATNIRLSFIYTAIGIVTSFLILALFFFTLKQMEISISWGMQFQEQYFLIFILMVLSLFCLNTLGIFEIELPVFFRNSKIFNTGNNFISKNFFNGFFATLMATPCTAPFVGTAITIAFTQDPLILFLIFFFMGLGMSMPYVIISIFPRTIFILPKSGKWTNYTKYFLSLLLIATIIWVLNILLSFYNILFVILFLAIVLLLYISYKFNFYKYSITILLIIIFFCSPSISIFEQNKNFNSDEQWVNFMNVDLSQLIIDDEIIFVDLTADWCATCQFNKLNVLEKKKIKNVFNENNVILVRGDWTKPNKDIDKYLKNYNKFGIPFNIIYSSKYPNGIILSEILSEKEIVETIELIK